MWFWLCWLSLWSYCHVNFLIICLTLSQDPTVGSKLLISLYLYFFHKVYIHWWLWFVLGFPFIEVKDHLPRPSRSWSNLVDLLLSAFVIIAVDSPGLYLDVHGIFVSDISNLFLGQTFLTTFWITLLTWLWS